MALPRAMRRARWRRAAALPGCESGLAIIELALLLPILVVLLCGLWDLGRAIEIQDRLASAAEAGALYGTQSLAKSSDTAGMQAAAKSAAGDIGPSVTATAQRSCECPGGTSVSCSGSCAGGQRMLVYVSVTAATTFTASFRYPFVGRSKALTATAKMRAQ